MSDVLVRVVEELEGGAHARAGRDHAEPGAPRPQRRLPRRALTNYRALGAPLVLCGHQPVMKLLTNSALSIQYDCLIS